MARKPTAKALVPVAAAAAELDVATETAAVGYRDHTSRPIPGLNASFGLIAASYKDRENSMTDVVHRRLVQFGQPMEPVWRPTCQRWDVLLPRYAPDACQDPQALARLYDACRLPEQRDLAAVVTLRFERTSLIHRGWEAARAFAMHLAGELEVPVVAALHVSQLAARPHKPHVHLLCLGRRLIGSYPAEFAQELIGPDATQHMATRLGSWLEANR